MAEWQIFVSICAGIITLLTLIEKIRGTRGFKQINAALENLKKVPTDLSDLQENLSIICKVQGTQNAALLAILRHDLYRCFKDNREIGAWTDEDCRVQTNLHEIYQALKGNGEEGLWWEKKREWRIVTEVEYHELMQDFLKKSQYA